MGERDSRRYSQILKPSDALEAAFSVGDLVVLRFIFAVEKEQGAGLLVGGQVVAAV